MDRTAEPYQSRAVPAHSVVDTGPGPSDPRPPVIQVVSVTYLARPQPEPSAVTQVVSGPPDTGAEPSDAPRSARAETPPPSAAVAEPGNGHGGTTAVAAAAGPVPSPLRPVAAPTLPADPPAAAPGARAGLPGDAADRFHVRAAGPGDSLVLSDPSDQSRRTGPVAAVIEAPPPPGDEQSAEPPAVPPPAATAGVPDGLPPFNLSALGRGLRQFLDDLDWVGQELTGRGDEPGLSHWVVAGAAALVACEIARRELRRHARVGDADRDQLPGSASDHLFVG